MPEEEDEDVVMVVVEVHEPATRDNPRGGGICCWPYCSVVHVGGVAPLSL